MKTSSLKICGIGHSHLDSITHGYKANHKLFGDIKSFKYISLVNKKYKSKNNYSFSIIYKLLIKIKFFNTDILFCSFSGNAHNVIGLVNSDEPFDFFLNPKDEVCKNFKTRVLPKSLIKDVIKSHYGFYEFEWGIRNLRNLFPTKTIYCLESPPPVPSNSYLVSNIDSHIPLLFRKDVKRKGFSSYSLRYKLWKVHSELARDVCKKYNCKSKSHN